MSSVNIDVWGVFAQIRPLWGTTTGDFINASNGLKVYHLVAPSGGAFRLRISSQGNIGYYGNITSCYVFNVACRAEGESEGGGSGGDRGSGDGDVSGGIGGIILEAGETPNTGFSSKYYGEDKEEIFSTDMRIFDNEIDDDFGRDSLGGQ